MTRSTWIICAFLAPATVQAQEAGPDVLLAPSIALLLADMPAHIVNTDATSPVFFSLPELNFGENQLGQETARENSASGVSPLPIPVISPKVVKRYIGNSLEISIPQQGLVAHIDLATGSAMFRPGQHLLTGSLTEKDSWRREIAISFAPAGLSAIGLTLHADAFSGRMPILGGNGSRHGVGELNRWRQSGAWELGLAFGLPDDRLRYAGGISWSEQTFVTAARMDSLESLLARRAPSRRGRSQWHRLDADLLKEDRASASVYAIYGTMDDTYRSLLRRSTSPLTYGGTTRELGANFTVGSNKLSMVHTSNSGSDFSTELTDGRLTLGHLTLAVVRNDDAFQSDSMAASWQSRQKLLMATARLALQDLRHGGRMQAMMPDYVTVKVSRTHILNGGPEGQAMMDRNKIAVELGKTIGSSTTTLGVSRSESRSITPSLGTNSKGGETTLDLSHSLVGKGWDLSIYGSVRLGNSGDRTKRIQYGGISFSLSGAHRPKLSFAIDADSFESRGRVRTLDFVNRGVNFSATADFSYLIPGTKANGSYLLLKAFSDWSSSEISGLSGPSGAKLTPTVLVMCGARF